jgi:hypothetical protein
MQPSDAYIETVGFKSPLPITQWVHPRRCDAARGFFSFADGKNQASARASRGVPVTRQMRQSGKISAPIDL